MKMLLFLAAYAAPPAFWWGRIVRRGRRIGEPVLRELERDLPDVPTRGVRVVLAMGMILAAWPVTIPIFEWVVFRRTSARG